MNIVGNVYARSSRVAFLRHLYYARSSTTITYVKNIYLHPPPALKQHIANNSDQYYYSLRCFASSTEDVINNTNVDDDDNEEDWMPPDDSPLVTKQPSSSYNNNNTTFDLPDNMTLISPEEIEGINEDEIEVIDLEATLNNPQNQQFLSSQEEIDETHDVSASEFDVESNDVGWKEVLKELRDAGKTDIMDRLVHEYKLQSYLDALDDDDDLDEDDIEESSGISASKSVAAASANDEEEWDEDFEASLEGLTIDEVIDELIENSPSLSQLEMEILSQEFDKSEQGEGDGIDIDSLEDDNVDLNDNTNYMEFRAMVLSDYYKKKKKDKRDPIAHLPTIPPPRTNWSTKSDFVDYPPDWKDYDSKAAFKKDFVEEDDDTWVPPSSQFVPSRSSNKHDDTKNGKENKDKSTTTNDLDGTIDWLQARRSRLGESTTSDGKKATHLLTPDQAETFRNQNSQIEVIPHTLFTTTELTTSLSAQGATEIHIIETSKLKEVHGVGIGCNYIMLATGRNASHIRVLADSVVRNLKARKLNERNVVGASLGGEGGEDIFSNKRNRNRARRNGAAINTSGKMDDDWMVVDCENIHVHIMEESTRRCLNIEGLFDTHPNSDGSILRSLDLDDEEAIDTYVANNRK